MGATAPHLVQTEFCAESPHGWDIFEMVRAGRGSLNSAEGRRRTVGDKSNRDGIGAKITVILADGSKQWQTVHSGSSYCSQSELPLTFGLNRNDKIARVEIEWPSGKVDKLTDLTANQLYVLKEGAGVSESKPLPIPQLTPAPTVGN
jgi:ASPIC and UnbV